MNRFLLMGVTADRADDSALKALRSAAAHLPGWTPVVVAQGCSPTQLAALRAATPSGAVLPLSERVGMHNAKLAGLAHIRALGASDYVVASVDDDMEFLDATDYDAAARHLSGAGVGMVSTNWRRTLAACQAVSLRDEVTRQKIVYTGGGLLFRSDVASIIGEIPKQETLCDNTLWSAVVYAAGRVNLRFLGSVCIHRICGRGGRRAWIALKGRPLPRPDLVTFRPCKGDGPNQYHIAADRDLTPLAHQLHAMNRLQLIRDHREKKATTL